MRKVVITFCFLLSVFLLKAQSGSSVQTKQTFTIDVKKVFDKTKPPYVKTIINSVPYGRDFKVDLTNEKDAETDTVISKKSIWQYVNNQDKGIHADNSVFNDNLRIDNLSMLSFQILYSNKDTLKLVFVPEEIQNDSTLRTASFLVFSFIKSLAGTEVRDELLDILLKINYGPYKRTFSLFGADAGINTPKHDSASSLLRLNEATANINTVIFTHRVRYRSETKRTINNEIRAENKDTLLGEYDKKAYETSAWSGYAHKKFRKYLKDSASLDKLSRVGFVGGGLKVFYTNPYIGGHVGIMEINSKLMGSYFMVGYYYSPYLRSVKTLPANDSSRFYRNNIYFEAGLNAFGNVPTILKSIRFKFGLMLPFAAGGSKHGDTERPLSTDAIYRLAIEVPIGGVFKF